MSSKSCAIVGAGIAGVAVAYWLACRSGYRNIILIDRHMPLSFTTASSGENFRDCWPQPSMTAFTSRSIDLMDMLFQESAGAFNLRYSGYEFVSESTDSQRFNWQVSDEKSGSAGMEKILSAECIHNDRAYLSPAIKQVVCIRRAGVVDVQAMGAWMLREAKKAGVKVIRGEVIAMEKSADGSFELALNGDVSELVCDQLVLTAGPFVNELAGMLGVDLPIENVLQQKIVMPDPLGIVPRDMPFTIFADPQRLAWSEEEAELLAGDPDFAGLLDQFPAGLHIKPEPGNQIKMGWAFNRTVENPGWSPHADDRFAEVVVRGAQRFIPALNAYVEQMPGPIHSYAGYYTRTPENLPLIGALGVENAFVVAALSGYGTMAACAAAELCGGWMDGATLPDYSAEFSPGRYDNPELMMQIRNFASDGQL